MAEQESPRQPNRQQIFAIGMILVLIPGILFLTTQGSGGGGGPDLQTNRFGTFSFNTQAGVQVYGPFNVTITPPFASSPNDIKLVPLGLNGVNNLGLSTINFLSEGGSTVTGGVWTNMPAASTELFGNTCCRSFANMNGFGQGCFLVVDISAVSNTIGAILFVQWATATAGPWTTFTGSNVDVHSIASNPRTSSIFGTGTGQSSSVYLRIAGSGGGGTGDTPQFSHIDVTCAGNLTGVTASWLNNNPGWFLMFVSLGIADPIGGNTIIIQWSAYLCTSGQGNNNC